MPLDRRTFLKLLGLAPALPLAARLPVLRAPVRANPQLLPITWFQTTRIQSFASVAYLEQLDRIMNGAPNHFIEQFKR